MGVKKRFCEKIGISSGHLNDWLKEKAKPKMDYQNKICSVYGISRNWLASGIGDPKEANCDEISNPDTKRPVPQTDREMLIEAQGEIKAYEKMFRQYIDRIENVISNCEKIFKDEDKNGGSNTRFGTNNTVSDRK